MSPADTQSARTVSFRLEFRDFRDRQVASDAHFVERDMDDQSFVQDDNVFERAPREDRMVKRAIPMAWVEV
jgi:hypothetical protein